ncbi:SUF system Fe-S cluster assembly regulator [Denitrobaculum tricleocarpae]|uniref:SUF system Fe-S cluster assembly regulator n=1 Tax=Denitrobaculum tricleocarpae TaxID=2591009 RepID=A0A545TPA6_9PROT|nr:SUF system Fe-S cluster assembly regulator [Denitrobaculum tricleocarpae]TQV79055.1 SUF system Fe-S cluster assembly regulator [Denitrobaculum tricleocarpae]
MFRLNRLTDYAVVVMSQMAMRPEKTNSAQEIAAESGVPLPTVSKLLGTLTRAGLMTSQRGATGGYVLSRSAESITMAEIIQALEGPIALTACVEGAESNCEVESLCPMRGNWNRVNSAIHSALSSVTLADMSMSMPMFGVPAPGENEQEARRNTA